MRHLAGWSLVLILFLSGMLAAEEPAFVYPRIAGYGGVVEVPAGVEPPAAGAKIVFDVTASSKPGEVNKGLETVARYLNLQAAAGVDPAATKLAVVLHGSAIQIALDNKAYALHTSLERNPNLELIQELKKCGVELYVCGQSLARNKLSTKQVHQDIAVAVSAMTVNVNKQRAGYAYLAIH